MVKYNVGNMTVVIFCEKNATVVVPLAALTRKKSRKKECFFYAPDFGAGMKIRNNKLRRQVSSFMNTFQVLSGIGKVFKSIFFCSL